jgi:hypothetical protein
VEIRVSESTQKAIPSFRETDVRYRIVKRNQQREAKRDREKLALSPAESAKQVQKQMQDDKIPWELYLFVGGGFLFVMLLSASVVGGAIWYFDLWKA